MESTLISQGSGKEAWFSQPRPQSGLGQLRRGRGRLVRLSSLWHHRRAGI